MEITREYDEDCDVFNLMGVLIGALVDSLDMPFEDVYDVADFTCEMLYDYACGLSKDNQIPAIVFMHGKVGEFTPIEVPEEDGEVM